MTIVTLFSASTSVNYDTQKPDGYWTPSSKMKKIITKTESNADQIVDLTSRSMSSHLLSEGEYISRQTSKRTNNTRLSLKIASKGIYR